MSLSEKEGCGFPLAKMVAIFSLCTGALTEAIVDSPEEEHDGGAPVGGFPSVGLEDVQAQIDSAGLLVFSRLGPWEPGCLGRRERK